jgi:hypothetical protein
MPGSSTTPGRTSARAHAPVRVAFRFRNRVGTRDMNLYEAQWLACVLPTDASPPPLRTTTHGSGPMWIATPSSRRTCTDYSFPVSRRTAKDSVRYPKWLDEFARKIAGNSKNAIVLEHARTAAQAEFDLARVRHVKVALIQRISALGALDAL